MAGRWPFTAEKIATRLALIAPLIHRRRVELAPFRLCELPRADVNAPISDDPAGWSEIAHDSYWGAANLNFLMKSHFTIPDDWDASALALYLPLGILGDIFNHPEALVHVGRTLIGSADRYHHTVPLDAALADGNRHLLSLQGWTGLAGWPPDPNSPEKLRMGRPALVEIDTDLRAFHDLAQVALDTVRVLDRDSAEFEGLLRALDEAFIILDTRAPLGDALYASVPAAHACLIDGIAAAGAPLDQTLHAIGHAHMDIAYLWPVSQIRLKNARTYSNVLRLMDDDPDFRFSHSQPQLYAMVEEDYPDIFSGIKARVAEGRWEVMGGMWVEPDLNIPGPEALVQQLTLGRRYFKDRFGEVETPVLWLPDTFGFPAQIPQLMRHAGLKWFVTNKLNWNQRNKVPSSTHYWEALDGSRVLAHILTTPRDVQYLPFPTNYKSDLTAKEVLGTTQDETIPSQITDLPICFGYGDGGGGPTRDLLAKAHAYAAMPGMPKLKMSTVREAFERIETQAKGLKVWRGEHYMEGHRGVLTSQGWIKRANRAAERALHEAEALSAMAGLRPDLKEAWQLLCLNQFHDIVTGTSVPEVFEDARCDFARIEQIVEEAAAKAAHALSGHVSAVANTAPICGPRVIEGPDNEPLYFDDLDAYAVTPITQATAPSIPVSVTASSNGATLQNEHLRVEINAQGQLTQVFDNALSINVLREGAQANVLQAFEDRPICWDAWDIDPSFEDRTEVVGGDTHFEIIETGPLRSSVRARTKWRNSVITQTISLCANSRRVDFRTEVDWHEQHTLLKAAFPTGIFAPTAEFDIQWGHVERATTRQTSFDQARFEVPAQKWARLVDDTRAVAILNDCKYGYDVLDDTIRITLIKSSTSPDPMADQGQHVFTYSLLATQGPGRTELDHEAYALNTPIRLLPESGASRSADGSFVISDQPNVIIETLKPADMTAAVILRVFDAHGKSTKATFDFSNAPVAAHLVSFDESPIESIPVVEGKVSLEIGAFEIKTLRVHFEA